MVSKAEGSAKGQNLWTIWGAGLALQGPLSVADSGPGWVPHHMNAFGFFYLICISFKHAKATASVFNNNVHAQVTASQDKGVVVEEAMPHVQQDDLTGP